jgi:hypothetical protein
MVSAKSLNFLASLIDEGYSIANGFNQLGNLLTLHRKVTHPRAKGAK